MDIATQIKEKILSLQTALLEQHPIMPALLRDIHSNLKANPDVVTLLTEEEICIIVNGLERQTNTFIAASVVASKSKTKSAKNITLEDL